MKSGAWMHDNFESRKLGQRSRSTSNLARLPSSSQSFMNPLVSPNAHRARVAEAQASENIHLKVLAGSLGKSYFNRCLLQVVGYARSIDQFKLSPRSSVCRSCTEPEDEVKKSWNDLVECGLVREVSDVCRNSNSVSELLRAGITQALKTLARGIEATPNCQPEVFMQTFPILILLKRSILLRRIDGLDSDCVRLFRRWLDVVSDLVTVLKSQYQDLMNFIAERLLEIETSTDDSISAIITELVFSGSSDHRVFRSIIILVEALLGILPRTSTATRHLIERFIAEVAGCIVGGNRTTAITCQDTEGRMIRFLLKTHAKTSDFHMSQFILNFFRGPPECAIMHLEAIMSKPLDTDIVHLAVEFACSELSFTTVVFKRFFKSGSEDGSRVPKLFLDGLTQERADPDSWKSFPLAEPNMLSLNFVTFIVNLLFLPNGRSFNTDLLDPYPSLSGKPSILFHLLKYADWMSSDFCEILSKSFRKTGFSVLADLLWNVTDFENLSLLGSGQFGAVYKTKTRTAVKFIKVPITANDRCTLLSALGEALCQSLVPKESFCLSLISCGRTSDKQYFFIESELFSSNLKTFRKSRPDISDTPTLIQLLLVFAEILSGVQFLHNKAGIVHYDFKLENILVDYGGLNPSSDRLIVPRIAIADFGEARILFNNDICTKNRGTECIKSPEMLSIASSSRLKETMSSRTKYIGTGTPSDIWSVGCLFFELITGDYLFSDPEGDWLAFYYRLTNEKEDILDSDAKRKLHNRPELIDFLRFILVREPSRRPNIESVVTRFQSVYRACLDRLPEGTLVEIPPLPGSLVIKSAL